MRRSTLGPAAAALEPVQAYGFAVFPVRGLEEEHARAMDLARAPARATPSLAPAPMPARARVLERIGAPDAARARQHNAPPLGARALASLLGPARRPGGRRRVRLARSIPDDSGTLGEELRARAVPPAFPGARARADGAGAGMLLAPQAFVGVAARSLAGVAREEARWP